MGPWWLSCVLLLACAAAEEDDQAEAPWLLCRQCGNELTSRDAFLPQPTGDPSTERMVVEMRPEPWLDIAANPALGQPGQPGQLRRFVNAAQTHFDVAAFRDVAGARVAAGSAGSGGTAAPGHSGHSHGGDGGGTRESFYPGYSWQPVVCSRCGQHVGWRFESTDARMCEAGGGTWSEKDMDGEGGAGAEEADEENSEEEGGEDEEARGDARSSEEELLARYAGACITLDRGWWSYRWCHGAEVRQQHVDAQSKKVEVDWSLGAFNAASSVAANRDAAAADQAKVSAGNDDDVVESTAAEGRDGGDEPAVYRLVYEGGQPCDETGGKGRQTTVLHRCCAGDKPPSVGDDAPPEEKAAAAALTATMEAHKGATYIRGITEPSMCTYELEVCVAELCDAARAPPRYMPRWPPCCDRSFTKVAVATAAAREVACARHCKRSVPRTAEESAATRAACKAASAVAKAGRTPAFMGLLWSKVVAEDSDDLAWAEGIEPITALNR